VTAEVTIRRTTSADLKAIAQLEEMSGDVRWTESMLAAELAKPISRYWVAVASEGIVGYTGGWLVPPELQVANIVIQPVYQCRGVGRTLLETLIKEATSEGCTHATLEVRASNAHAQALYRRVGFQETGRRPHLYTNPDEDAVLMETTW